MTNSAQWPALDSVAGMGQSAWRQGLKRAMKVMVQQVFASLFQGSRPHSIEQLAVPVARVNVDEEPGIAARYDVLSIPTVILFAAGEARGSVIGLRPRDHFERWLAEVLPATEIERDA